MSKRIAIVGSRSFTNYNAVEDFVLPRLSIEEIDLVVSGGANGADYLGKLFAMRNRLPFREIRADWREYGKRAGFLRNIEIVNAVDMVFAFWNGDSKGTKHTIDRAHENDIPCYIYYYMED